MFSLLLIKHCQYFFLAILYFCMGTSSKYRKTSCPTRSIWIASGAILSHLRIRPLLSLSDGLDVQVDSNLWNAVLWPEGHQPVVLPQLSLFPLRCSQPAFLSTITSDLPLLASRTDSRASLSSDFPPSPTCSDILSPAPHLHSQMSRTRWVSQELCNSTCGRYVRKGILDRYLFVRANPSLKY